MKKTALILILLLIFGQSQSMRTPEWLSYGTFSFFDPYQTDPQLKHFFFSFRHYYRDGREEAMGLESMNNVDENLEDWKKYFQEEATKKDIQYVVYESTRENLARILKYIQNKQVRLFKKLRKNSLIKYWKKYPQKASEVIKYLNYAKQNEAHSGITLDYWNEKRNKKKKDKKSALKLIQTGIKAIQESQDKELKLRYAFQVVKLSFYNEPKKCIAYYQKWIANSSSQSVLKYWALNYVATLTKDEYEGNRLYIEVFRNSQNKRLDAYKNLKYRIKTDEDWNKTLLACQNNEEKASLYFIRAFDFYSNALEEMKDIYALAPKSKYLEVLLSREINKLEQDFLGVSHERYGEVRHFHQDKFPRPEAQEYLRDLKTFCAKLLQEKKISNPNLWQLALGYLDYLKGDLLKAKKTFENLSQNKTIASKLKQQLEVCQFLLDIALLKKLDRKTEDKLFQRYLTLEKSSISRHQKDFFSFMLYKFSQLYTKQGQIGKAFACTHNFYHLKFEPNERIVKHILAIIDREDKTSLEKYLLVQFQSKMRLSAIRHWLVFNNTETIFQRPESYFSTRGFYASDDYHSHKNMMLVNLLTHEKWSNIDKAIWQEHIEELKKKLLEMKGTIYLQQSKFKKALQTFEDIFESYEQQFVADPFKVIIKDCIPCQVKKEKDWIINKYTIAKKLVDLEEAIMKNPFDAENYISLGNYYYNTTYWGNTWNVLRYYRGYGYNSFRNYMKLKQYKIGEREYNWDAYYRNFVNYNNNFDFSKAIENYQKALFYARLQGNQEQATKACYFLAKCEQKQIFSKNLYIYNEEKEYQNPHQYFRQLQNEFSDTKYYKEILKECAYFKHFAS